MKSGSSICNFPVISSKGEKIKLKTFPLLKIPFFEDKVKPTQTIIHPTYTATPVISFSKANYFSTD